jgi:uncharacterized protein YbbC (DUF1343 family)
MKLGIDQISEYQELFTNKRVGLITNPTGLNSDFVSSIDILNEQTSLRALFAPEHGIRGELQAGVHLDDYVDSKTNIPVFSLYGKNKKPSKEMMDMIDILVFDIQDVGSRFYTYVYTMAYAMEACKEHHKTMVILDRPNPLGTKVEGTILDLTYRSFVGYYPITERYGLTIGELALLFNNEFDIHCDLEIIPLKDYDRRLDYIDLNIPFIMPSPNIPTPLTTYAYLSTCFFEGTNMSEGRGTTKPFFIVGSPFMNVTEVLNKLKEFDLPGVTFRSLYFTPTFSKWQGENCQGIELIITDKKVYEPVKTGYILFDIIKNTHKEFEVLPPFKEGRPHFLDFLNGNDFLRTSRIPLEEQLKLLEDDSKEFTKVKRRYHLYE